MIPKILHYFYDSALPTPDCVTRWPAILGPDWEIRMWEPHEVVHHQKDWLIENKAWATLADVARLQAMVEVGGIYLDTDIELIKPPGHLLEKAWVGVEGAFTICNAALGSQLGNPFFKCALRKIRKCNLIGIVNCGHVNLGGPVLLTELWNSESSLPTGVEQDGMITPEIDILPQRIWYPYRWDESPRAPFPDTTGIHRWEGRWKK